MTLPSSGPISLSDIQAEFGGAAPTSLNEYYAGGAYVPAGASGTNGPVPSSGVIGLASFYGTTKAPTIALTGRTVSYTSGGLLQAQVAYRVASDAFVYSGTGSAVLSYAQQEQWDSQPATVGDYEVRLTRNSGTSPTGSALGTWLPLSSTQTWVLTASAGNVLTSNLTAEIRKTSSGVVLATATIILEADAL